MTTYLATVDIHDLGVQYYGRVLEPPTITRSLGTEGQYGFTEYSDISMEILDDPEVTSPYDSRGIVAKYQRDLFRGQTAFVRVRDVSRVGAVLEWTGRIMQDELTGHGTVRLQGSGVDRNILAQRIPTKVITTDEFPGAVDVGKSPPFVFGHVDKLKFLLVNNGLGGNYEFLACIDAPAAGIPAVFRDVFNQGLAEYPPGAQSFAPVPASVYTVAGILSSTLTVLRFTTPQINDQGSLVGIYADFEGKRAERDPVRAIQTLLSHSLALNLPVDVASFDTASAKLTQLTAPYPIYCDGQTDPTPRAAQEYIRPLLQLCGGRLYLNGAGQVGILIDGPPATIKYVLGAGLGDGPHNLTATLGRRYHINHANRPKRYILDYQPDTSSGAYLFQRTRDVDTAGRDVPEQNPFLRHHRSADVVASRRSKELFYEQDRIDGVETTIEGWGINEGDWVYYSWPEHGYDLGLYKVRQIKKELTKTTLDLVGTSPAIWQYSPVALPSNEYLAPDDAPPPAPPAPGTELIETIRQYVTTSQIASPITWQTVKTFLITIDTTGNKLVLEAYISVLALTMSESIFMRLRDATTGANIVVGQTLATDTEAIPGYTTYTATWLPNHPSTPLALTQTANAGDHTVYLEISNIGTPFQNLYYGSLDVLAEGQQSNGYLQAQEFT